jgi:hypothetical protein
MALTLLAALRGPGAIACAALAPLARVTSIVPHPLQYVALRMVAFMVASDHDEATPGPEVGLIIVNRHEKLQCQRPDAPRTTLKQSRSRPLRGGERVPSGQAVKGSKWRFAS